MVPFNRDPLSYARGKNREVAIFTTGGKNIDEEVVRSFGEEWLKFQYFSDEMINVCAAEYFDIVTNNIVNKNTYMLDIGCGTGRWTKYLSSRAGFIEAIDPSDAIFAADNLLGTIPNIRLAKASIETIPFNDETFDFIMSIGVLHHTPDPAKSMIDCVKKVKQGGYFYCYLYHNLESKTWFSRLLFQMGELVRKIVCRFPMKLKALTCDILAVVIYMPLLLWVKILMAAGLKKLALKMPLAAYHNKSFFIIRNDSLDKFGTKLENRYSKSEVEEMMKRAGLTDIVISDGTPYYHAIGKKPIGASIK